mmetsp:Transcript_14885/g.52214  ORF Transcript_14885/g.52214 Transcript_14885/m.52214 type:complete len:89 (-) Transcript_14885:52-318(-)
MRPCCRIACPDLAPAVGLLLTTKVSASAHMNLYRAFVAMHTSSGAPLGLGAWPPECAPMPLIAEVSVHARAYIAVLCRYVWRGVSLYV